MKLLNKILKKFGLVAIPIKPSDNDISDICFKWDHGFGYRTGRSDEEILLIRKTFPLNFELTQEERESKIYKASEAYRCIVKNPRLYK
jgi:hypothetical protein